MVKNWNAALYMKFGRERTQPSIDLAARLPDPAPAKAIDLGCGPGNSTKVLRDRFPMARIVGADVSDSMVAAAREACPDLTFLRCDLATELDSLETGWDVVFSNACIQWVPDHPRLLPGMFGLLAPGGTLAVQVPVNESEPVHRIIGETAASAKWRDRFVTRRIFHTLPAAGYHELLGSLTGEYEIWETVYHHVLDSHEEILEWYRGTGLRPWLEQLPEDLCPAFERDILAGLVENYPKLSDGRVVFRFPRLFMTARRPNG